MASRPFFIIPLQKQNTGGYLLIELTAAILLLAANILIIASCMSRIEYLKYQCRMIDQALAYSSGIPNTALFTVTRHEKESVPHVTILSSYCPLEIPIMVTTSCDVRWQGRSISFSTVR